MAFPFLMRKLFDNAGKGMKLLRSLLPKATESIPGAVIIGDDLRVSIGADGEPVVSVGRHLESNGSLIGTASSGAFGHVRLSDDPSDASGAGSGVAASPECVRRAKRLLLELYLGKEWVIAPSSGSYNRSYTWEAPMSGEYSITCVGAGGDGGAGARGTWVQGLGITTIWGGGGGGGGSGQRNSKQARIEGGARVSVTISRSGSAFGTSGQSWYLWAPRGSDGSGASGSSGGSGGSGYVNNGARGNDGRLVPWMSHGGGEGGAGGKSGDPNGYGNGGAGGPGGTGYIYGPDGSGGGSGGARGAVRIKLVSV